MAKDELWFEGLLQSSKNISSFLSNSVQLENVLFSVPGQAKDSATAVSFYCSRDPWEVHRATNCRNQNAYRNLLRPLA